MSPENHLARDYSDDVFLRPFPDFRSDTTGSRLYPFLADLSGRIKALDPKLHIFVPGTVNRNRLMADAETLMSLHPNPLTRPPLFGVPVAVKDIFRCDKFPTTAGTLLPPEALAGDEASCISRLKREGALIIGKTVTTEFAYFEPGATRNPHRTTHTPGGSSSGSAAGVAAGLFPAALGSQTVGSIIRPASYCGVFGVKPSRDRISKDGVVPFSWTADTMGVFSGHPATARRLLAAMIVNWHEQTSEESPSLKGIRLGIPSGPYLEQADEGVLHVLARARQTLTTAGVEIREIPFLEDITEINERHFRLTEGEMGRVHRKLFAEYGHLYRPRTRDAVIDGQKESKEDLDRFRASALELRERSDRMLAEEGMTAWLCPAAVNEAPEGWHSTGSPVMNLPWSHAGVPAVTIPAGPGPGGLPVGIQIAGAYGADESLMQLAELLYPLFVSYD